MKKPNLKAFAGSFKTRSFQVGSYSVTATAIVLAILVVINLLVGALPSSMRQFDISANGLFSISEQTEKLVSSLDKDVTMYWIVQPGFEDDAISKLLKKYAALSERLTLQSVDPDVYPTFAQSYYSGDVYNNSVVVECGDRYKYVSYTDIYLEDYTNYYVTGEVTYEYDGENALTSAIYYVISEDLPKIYSLTGHGETTLADTFSGAIIDDNFMMEELSLLTVEAVPEDADILLIHSPTSDINAQEAQMITAYLQAGGKLMLLTMPPQGAALSNLESVMASYGVTAVEGLVIEGDQNHYLWGTPYYLLPDLQNHTITNPLISGNYYTLLPLAQGLVLDQVPEHVTATELLTTSSAAFSKPKGYSVTTYEKEEGDIDGPFSLAVALTDENTGAQIVWVSSGTLADEETNYRISGGNLDFFMNSLNWMCQREDIISIRAKSLNYEYLTIDDSTASLMSVFIVAVLPAAYLIIGICTWIRRKRA